MASEERDEVLAGSASTVRSFLLVEDPGPWGRDAVRDGRFLGPVADRLRPSADRARVRVLAIRRHGTRRPGDSRRVFAAWAGPDRPWLEQTSVTDAEELLGLDLAALGSGHSPGLEPTPGPVFAVCTHGRHDTCCAERGRPVAQALAAALPEHAWEVSHIGGDRYAANMLVLPHGLYYGRVDVDSVADVARGHLAGVVDLDRLRGRTAWPFAVQAAEIALRRRLGAVALGAVRVRRRSSADGVTTVVLACDGEDHEVRVRTTPAPPALLTCSARRENRPPVHEVLSVAALPSG